MFFFGYFEIYEMVPFFSFYPRGDRLGRYVKAIGSQMKTKEELDEVHINLRIFFIIKQVCIDIFYHYRSNRLSTNRQLT